MRRVLCVTAAVLGVAPVMILCLRGSRVPPIDAERTQQRIVSLAPSVTEMLFALGVGGYTVGVTDRCDYPPEARDIESIGAFGAPSIEKLLALSPDLIIGTGLQHRDVTTALRRSGIRVLWIETTNFSEMFEALRVIGKEVGQPRRAEEVVAAMQTELQALAERYRDIPVGQRPRVFVELWNDPITTAGKRSFVDELITSAGGVNVAHELDSAYPVVSPEQVIEWNPDVILLGYMNQRAPKKTLAKRIGWGDVEAVRSGNLINDISSDVLLRPGPRLIQGAKALSQRLHSQAGGEVDQK